MPKDKAVSLLASLAIQEEAREQLLEAEALPALLSVLAKGPVDSKLPATTALRHLAMIGRQVVLLAQ